MGWLALSKGRGAEALVLLVQEIEDAEWKGALPGMPRGGIGKSYGAPVLRALLSGGASLRWRLEIFDALTN